MTPIEAQFNDLKAAKLEATLERLPSGAYLITIPGVRLPSGWNRPSTTVHFVAPVGYPAAKPDCFWTEPGLALEGGRTPQATNHQALPEKGGPARTWFSWHVTQWNPLRDTLLSYLRVIERRLDPAR